MKNTTKTAPKVNIGEIEAEARAEERARIASILDHKEAEGRDASAKHLALATDMSAEKAIALLATFPVTKPDADPFAEVLAVMASNRGSVEAPDGQGDTVKLLSAHRAFTGRKPGERKGAAS
jgi:hypothetical protein